MSDLERLIEAVEAGDRIPNNAGRAFQDHIADSAAEWVVQAAEWESLDAALRLHEALLPGWRVLQLHQFEAGHWLAQVYHPQGEDWPKWQAYPKAEATSEIPARAWLLAILRALQANTETEGK